MFKNLKNLNELKDTNHEVAINISVDESIQKVSNTVLKTACVLIGVNALAHVTTSFVDHKFGKN